MARLRGPTREPPLTTDYDAPRGRIAELSEDGNDVMPALRRDANSTDIDAEDPIDAYDLPGRDLLDEEVTAAVMPMLGDEFRCGRCFLLHHRSRLASGAAAAMVCTDCT